MKRLFDIFLKQAQNRPNSDLLGYKENGIWKTLKCKEVVDEAERFAEGLLALGIKNEILEIEKQEKIALVSPNRPEWVITDLAVQLTGAVLTPIYPTISPHEFAFILNEAEIEKVIFSDKEMYKRFESAFDSIPTLKHFISFEPFEEAKHWKSMHGNQNTKQERLQIMERIKTENIATLIYTSGTTGKPKGVMLSHENIYSNVMDCMPVFDFAEVDEKALSFLPLNHIFERTVTYIYIEAGMTIYYAENLDTIGENLKEVQPIVFTCVPRLLEKVYERILITGHSLTGIKKKLFFWANDLGMKYDTVDKGSAWYRFQLKIANKIIFNKWREALGGRVRAVVSGSAPLQDKLIRIFCAAQINIMEGYGLTETSPVVSVNLRDEAQKRIGTVGPAIKNVEVKIADDGEILTRGKNNMVGYYKNQEMTDEVIDKDGWLHTGDIGVLEEGKYLRITDRKKEIFKTSGGKYVAPQAVEGKIRESHFIEQMMVFGPNRKFVAALIVPSFDHVRSKLKRENISLPKTNKELIQMPEVIDLIQKQVEKYNSYLNHVEQVKKFTLLADEWTVDNGILTPKLSLRRKKVYERYEAEIEALYTDV